MNSTNRSDPAGDITGVLHVFVAFDWGDEIDLDEARRLIPAELHSLPRKPRTPSSIRYQPAPLRSKLSPVSLDVAGIGAVSADLDVTLFDFGVASAAAHVPFQVSASRLIASAGSLAESDDLIHTLQSAVEPLYHRLRPAVQNPVWSDIREEYFVFQLLPESPAVWPETLLEQHASWLAGLVRLEAEPLSGLEIAEAIRQRLSYSPRDLFVADWAAAVIVDQECEELLDAVAFANLQLLEFRHIDSRLETRLQEAYNLIRALARTWLPFWRSHGRSVRAMGELKVEANVMLERTGDVLKLVGDPYLARAYRLLASRFYLDEWGLNIRRAIAVLEGTYQVLSDQAAAYRMEALELTIVLLIVFEILMALLRR